MSITINSGKTFLITDESGDITGGERGFYSSDTRLMSRYVLTVDGERPDSLTSGTVDYFSSIHILSIQPGEPIAARPVAVIRKRELDDGLTERIELKNYGPERCHLELRLEFDSDFADVFEVRQGRTLSGATAERSPVEGEEPLEAGSRLTRELKIIEESRPPSERRSDWKETVDGALLSHVKAGVRQELGIAFSKKPRIVGRSAIFTVRLESRDSWELTVSFDPVFIVGDERIVSAGGGFEKAPSIGRAPVIESDYDELCHSYRQSLKDLVALELRGESISKGDVIPAAGVPWYLTIFGRDCLIAAYQTVPFMPDLAKGVLRTLAKYQGEREDARTGEQPGRILHEMRLGPLAEAGKVPKVFYGTIDATILYPVLLSEYYRWSGDIETVKELLEPAKKAIAWIDEYGDLDGDGFVEYTFNPEWGRYNQGWKDSWASIAFSDGSLPDPPIALCEVQGYVIDAKTRVSELFSVFGMDRESDRLREEAIALRKRFEETFWMEEENFYAQALDGKKRRVDSITSNPGHLLWSGAIGAERAKLIAARLFQEDMFSGWGVRTMSSREKAYNPMSYHNGSIWPHDNSLIMNGLLRYGFVEPARKLVILMDEAANFFPNRTPPELFCGFSMEESKIPVAYPESNSPQAWASGSFHLLIRTMLGLEPDAADNQLSLDPWLIPKSNYLRVEGLFIAGSSLSFEVRRKGDSFAVTVLDNPAGMKLITPSGIIRERGEKAA